MYPIFRLSRQVRKWRDIPLDPWDTHVSHHRILPWDLDMFRELNNGLTLTIYDMGRIPYAFRTQSYQTMKAHGMFLTIAGSMVRYRKRITLWQMVEQRTRVAGFDARFLYFDQSLWVDGECAGQGIFRAAVVKNHKMQPMDDVIALLDRDDIHANRPDLPDWIAKWTEAETMRPWPPERR